MYGYLGPNGPGKTTTIRLLLGLHRPSAGRAELFGIDAWRDPVTAHRRVAYVAGRAVPVARDDRRRDAGVPRPPARRYRQGLPRRARASASTSTPRKKVRALSKGNRQKVQLVAALATRADLLVLDEPTSGLDPLMEMAFRDCVTEAKERGQTVFLSSHILSEVEALCDRVGILGRAAGRPGDARRAAPPGRADHGGHVRRPGAGAVRRCPGCRCDGRAERAAVRGQRQRRAADRRARRAPGRGADEPRAVTRGDLPAPLRRLRPAVGASAAARATARRAARRRRARSARWRAGVPRRADAHDRVRVPVRRVRLHPSRSATGTRTRRSPSGWQFAHSFGPTTRCVLFYGEPYDLLTVGGYSAWRVGGMLAIVAAMFGLLAAVRALRAEEDAGRAELVLAVAVAADASTRRVWRDRGGALAAVARGVRSASSSAACRSAGRRTWRSRSSPSCRCSLVSARSRASSRRRGAWRSSSAARSSAARSCCA